jgi:hypothetical protein
MLLTGVDVFRIVGVDVEVAPDKDDGEDQHAGGDDGSGVDDAFLGGPYDGVSDASGEEGVVRRVRLGARNGGRNPTPVRRGAPYGTNAPENSPQDAKTHPKPGWNALFLTGNAPFFMGNASFFTGNASFLIGNASFLIENASFLIGNASFLIENAPFLIGNASFLMANTPFPALNTLL